MYNGSCESVCNVTLDPTKKYLRWEWRFVHVPRKLGFFFCCCCCYRKEEGVAGGCLMEWDGIKSNQIKSRSYHICTKKPPQKSLTPPMVCHTCCHLLTRVNPAPTSSPSKKDDV